jgi:feruloyl esterase
MYHGWSDPAIPPGASLQYYERVRATMGRRETAEFFRLFMAPGMQHCAGGPGPNTFDAIGALERWVEDGAAPDEIVATHRTAGVVDRTRPLCPYPQVARWDGTGDPDDAASFTCRKARR